MTYLEPIRCTYCAGTKICKNGHSRNGTQRWLCQDKGCATRSFQREYRYVGYWAGVSGRIEQATLSGSGVADICRMLGASKNKVISDLKKKEAGKLNPYLVDDVEAGRAALLDVELCYSTEWDEFWP